MPIAFGLAGQLANLHWWSGLAPAVQTFLQDKPAGPESSIFDLAATETSASIVSPAEASASASAAAAAPPRRFLPAARPCLMLQWLRASC